jgi:flagellin
MSMATSAIKGSLRDVSKAGQAATRLGQQLTTGKKVQTPQDGAFTWLEAGRAQSTAGYLDAIHTGLNEVATNIRVAATTMQAIGELMGTMQGQLRQAQKYPAGDPIRQQLISDANGIRRQIDDLVNTTAQPGARNMIGLNGEGKTVHGQQVDTGPGGLNISVLKANATDAQLQNALQALQSAQTTLSARQDGLATDSADISRYLDQSSSVSKLYQSEAESLTGVDATEAAVELQSASMRQSLAMQSLASIGASRDAILELLH